MFSWLLVLFGLLSAMAGVQPVPFVVQSLSSRFAVVLGGFGFRYEELRSVEVVKHDAVCSGVISHVPQQTGRFLGDTSGMAEFVSNSVLYCRHSHCWKLDVAQNNWTKVAGFTIERHRAASVAVGDKFIVLGGKDPEGQDLIGFEEYDLPSDTWHSRPEWAMAQGRYSFCSVPLNDTALVIIGGYSQKGALSSVQLLDTATGRWQPLADLPKSRYGHACLLMELQGRLGILVSGGALTGSDVVFYDVAENRWKTLPSLVYKVDGHKMVLVEGIPTVFSWEHIEQFDGNRWIVTGLRLSESRSAFTVTTIPGHLVPSCA